MTALSVQSRAERKSATFGGSPTTRSISASPGSCRSAAVIIGCATTSTAWLG